MTAYEWLEAKVRQQRAQVASRLRLKHLGAPHPAGAFTDVYVYLQVVYPRSRRHSLVSDRLRCGRGRQL